MNKSGTEKIISVYWFVILFIVAGAIVYMAALFYGQPYEIRRIEADIMINQIADCLSKGGYLKENILKEGELLLNENNFLEICHLNFDVEDFKGWKNDQYYVEVSFYDFKTYDPKNLHQPDFKITKGNINLRDFVKKDELDKSKLPFSSSKSLYVFDNKEKEFIITIEVIIGKIDKNVE